MGGIVRLQRPQGLVAGIGEAEAYKVGGVKVYLIHLYALAVVYDYCRAAGAVLTEHRHMLAAAAHSQHPAREHKGIPRAHYLQRGIVIQHGYACGGRQLKLLGVYFIRGVL